MLCAILYLQVESVSSLVTLVDVTSSPQLGARCLLAAFACGSCACALFLLLIGWQEKWRPHEQCHASECAHCPADQSERRWTGVGHSSDRDGINPRSQPPGEDASRTSQLGQSSKKLARGVPDLASVQGHRKRAGRSSGLRGLVGKASVSLSAPPALAAGRPGGPGGSRSLAVLLAMTACGLMAASLWTPVFVLRVTLRRPLETLL